MARSLAWKSRLGSPALLLLLAAAPALTGCGGGGSRGGAAAAAAAVTTAGTGQAATGTGTTAPGVTPAGGSGTPGAGVPAPLPLPSGAVGGPRAEGVDVSRWQGTIDWARVAGAGQAFGIARVSDGLNTRDATFATNWAAMKRHGLVRGVYQFFRPTQGAVAQADLLVDAVEAAGGFGPGDLPPVLDLEVRDGLTAAQVNAQADAWLARVTQRTGMRPIIYTSPGFWNPLGAAAKGDSNELWVAHWGVSQPTLPGGWRSWLLWQTSDAGTVPGINGAVDTNLWNGSRDDVRAYAGLPPEGFYRGLAVNSTGRGYWLAGVTGGVFAYGDATARGTAGGQRHPAPFLAIARTPSGLGYWLVRADGRVVGFGDAAELGDLFGRGAAPVLALLPTTTGRGYWLVDRDGAVAPFGDAQGYGAPPRGATVVAAATSRAGRGYYVLTGDGAVHGFGDAVARGDLAGQGLAAPVAGIAASAGDGYWVALADGAVAAFGDAPALTLPARRTAAPVVSITPTLTGRGYWLLATDGTVVAAGDAHDAGPRAR